MTPPPDWHFERVTVRLGARHRQLELRQDKVRMVVPTVAQGTALGRMLRLKGNAR